MMIHKLHVGVGGRLSSCFRLLCCRRLIDDQQAKAIGCFWRRVFVSEEDRKTKKRKNVKERKRWNLKETSNLSQ